MKQFTWDEIIECIKEEIEFPYEKIVTVRMKEFEDKDEGQTDSEDNEEEV